MALLSFEDIERLQENFDVYDLVEMLGLTVDDLIDAFDYKIIENEEICERIGN
jgi:antitoxin component of RelBE/YafQ-DinJ toxin-antitoxin module